MTAKMLWPLAALTLLGACDSGSRGGVALCVNPANQQVEQCCLAEDGKYVPCSLLPGAGDASAGGDAGSTDGSGGGKDVAIPPDGTVTSQDTGAGVEDTGAGVEDTGAGVEDTGAGVEDTGAGVEDTGAVVEDMGSGVEDTGAGVEDTGAGVEDTGAGVEDTGAGVEDTGAGVEDTGSCEECVLGDELCDDEVTRKVCKETTPGCTAWKYISCSEGDVCADGACVVPCEVELPCEAPGQKECDGNKVRTCTEVSPDCAGWMTEEMCSASQKCEDGACVTVVECPAVTKCTKLGEMKCDGTGKAVIGCEPLPADETCLQWVTETSCAASQVCQDAACVAEGTLTCSELIGCVGQCQTQSCKLDCKAETSTAGQSQYNTLNDCANANCDFSAGQTSTFNACYMEKCKTAVLACDGYFIPGATGCGTFLDCQTACGPDKPCVDGCVAEIDYPGFVNLLKLYACMEQECDPFYTPGTTAYATCVQTSCSGPLSTCENDI